MAESLPLPQDLLPHQGIALVLDELTELEPGVSASGLWTPDERYFEGHFPGEPILPGHWTVESAALVGACAVIADNPNAIPMFRESASKFTGMVKPGDTLEITVNFEEAKERRGIATAQGTARALVEGTPVYKSSLLKAVWSV